MRCKAATFLKYNFWLIKILRESAQADNQIKSAGMVPCCYSYL